MFNALVLLVLPCICVRAFGKGRLQAADLTGTWEADNSFGRAVNQYGRINTKNILSLQADDDGVLRGNKCWYTLGSELLAMGNEQQNGLAAAMNCFPLLGVFDWEAQEGYLVETGDEPGTYRMNVNSDLTVRLVQTEPGPRPVVAICKFDKVGEKVSDDIFQFKPRSKLEVIKKKSSDTTV